MSNQVPPAPNHLHLHHHPRRAVDVRIPAIEKYAYCLCLHVKPTTIFIAVFKLIRALLFASILLNSEFALNDQGQELSVSGLDDRHKSTAAAMTILTRIIMASVSAVGIYAVVSGRAALLMPLYAMLLVDFFFSLPVFYSRDLESSFEDGLTYQHRGQHPQYARYSILVFSTVAMLLRIYFLCVVWKCYRYLRLIELVTPIRLSEIYPHLPPAGSQYPIIRVLGSIDSNDLNTGHNVTPPPYESVASSMKPPNYEEAIKSSGTVFTVNPSMNPADSPQCQPHQAQQTVVFTIPNSGQYQNVSTQVVGPDVAAVGSTRPSSAADASDRSKIEGVTSIIMGAEAPAEPQETPIATTAPKNGNDMNNAAAPK